MSDVKYH
jgi:vacuolar-type H+-ATPase subunit E/Vma4